jgi:hypothetical protein
MKKLLPFTIIAIILMSFSAKSQYNQMLLSQYKWSVYVNNQGNSITEEYRVDTDTTIFNQTWKKIKMISTQNPNFINKFFLREDTLTKKIYAMNPGQSPHLYFDFNANINDTLLLYNLMYNEIDTFVVNNKSLFMTDDSIYRNSLKIRNTSIPFSFFDYWIEGVGSTNGLYYGNKLQYLNSIATRLEASCYNNQLVYNGDDLFQNYCSYNISINETEINSIKLYPNPATDFLKIENISDKTGIAIYSIDGKLQKSLTVPENGIVKINELVEGIYFIKFQNDKGIVCKKFIKNKQ